MTELMLGAVAYGGYISIVKFTFFLALFFLWVQLLGWIYQDCQAIGIDEAVWGGIFFGAGAAGTLIWLISPVFIVGIVVFIAVVGVAGVAYVKQRNAKVLEFDRILTVEHIKGLFSGGKADGEKTGKEFVFVTANGNNVPMPTPKTPEFFGYRAAYDIFNDAIWRRAETIIFSPTHSGYNVAHTIDGMPVKQSSIDSEQMKYYISFVKQLADLDIKEKRKPQRGTFKVIKENGTTQWEVRTAGSTVGEQVKIRQIGQKSLMKLDDIGLTAEQYTRLNEIRDSKQGIFIVSGPKKSGVTTTFYAMLKNHDAFLNSINTLEMRITTDVPDITQNTFSLSDTGITTYAKKLRSILRMAPDVVGIVGCTDNEAAQSACNAAKDGIIEYVVIEADSAKQAFGKWVKLVGDKELAIDTLMGVCNQRLLRKLCEQCRSAYRPNPELLRKFNLPAEKTKALYKESKVLIDKRGKEVICDNCQGTGFVGRFGIFEIVFVDDELRESLKQAGSLPEIVSQFRGPKMLGLQQQALRKILDGTTAINEMIRTFSTTKKRK